MFDSAGSIPRANAGRLSATRLIKSIWTGSKNIAFGITSEVMNIPKTSTMLVESKNKMVFEIKNHLVPAGTYLMKIKWRYNEER